MDFAEAEQQFRVLEAGRMAGTIDDAAYKAQLAALQVTDARGRVWMMQERTGSWYVWENGAWQPAEPPRPAVVPPPPPPVAPASVPPPVAAATGQAAAPVRATPVVQPAVRTTAPAAAPVLSSGTNGLGFVLPLLLWAGLFGTLAYVAVNNGGAEQEGLLALAGVAVLFLVIILWRLTRHYEGTIEKLRIEQVTDTDDDGSTSTKNVTYAYVRTLDGKLKKIPARRGYAQGDRLFKRKGDWNPRKVKV